LDKSYLEQIEKEIEMLESIVTVAIVAVIALLAARSLYRTMKGGKPSCSCGSAGAACGGCSIKQPTIVKIQSKGAQ
jgi:hypothetical protein